MFREIPLSFSAHIFIFRCLPLCVLPKAHGQVLQHSGAWAPAWHGNGKHACGVNSGHYSDIFQTAYGLLFHLILKHGSDSVGPGLFFKCEKARMTLLNLFLIYSWITLSYETCCFHIMFSFSFVMIYKHARVYALRREVRKTNNLSFFSRNIIHAPCIDTKHI